ncbi:MAG: hypothetical protein MJB57_09775 [Gemmatimonadetes bacterium]|nr:hypothetical protein [Gemmatimonadota bacterium]
MTIVDIEALSVDRTVPVSTDVIDVVLPGNDWVYAFPRRDQWETIRSFNLLAGTEDTDSGTMRAGTLVRLHPSGDFIYGADNGLSPSDIEKYDIRDGAARVMYDSPYHGDFPFSGNLWISDDGTRIYARSGVTVRSSPSQTEDMLYSGSLAGSGSVQWAVGSSPLGRVLAVFSGSLDQIQVFGDEFLQVEGSVSFPDFTTPSGGVTAEGRFVFAQSDGEALYALVQAEASAGLQNDWGLVVIDESSIP